MKCPGQDMKYWKADAIYEVDCPKCSSKVEFYKDDTNRKCPRCGHRFVNPQLDFGCAAYCRFAEQCLGTLPAEFTGSGGNLLKNRVAVEVKRFFQTDFKKIRQASQVARHAEVIGRNQSTPLILCAAYMHGLGEAPARAILEKVGAEAELTREILEVLATLQGPEDHQSAAVQIVHDALTIEHLRQEVATEQIDRSALEKLIDEKLYTVSGKELARNLLS
jgi:DNA-directed RNA polymerase subunit RPC12/RpoP